MLSSRALVEKKYGGESIFGLCSPPGSRNDDDNGGNRPTRNTLLFR